MDGCGSVGDGGSAEDPQGEALCREGGQHRGRGMRRMAVLTRDRVSRLPAALWYRSGLPNCSSSQRILQSMLASSFSSINFLGGIWGSGPHSPPALPAPHKAEGCLVPRQRLPQLQLT